MEKQDVMNRLAGKGGTCLNENYLGARRVVVERGMKLPPHQLLDAYMQVPRGYCCWADELLVHPEKDCVLRRGRDVRDSLNRWILPASYVPREALGRQGVGLFVVPEDVRGENGKIVVHAKSVIVLDGMIQVSGKLVPGKPHELTKIPLVVSAEEFERLPESKKRWLYRIAGERISPLVRGKDFEHDGRHVWTTDGAATYNWVAGVVPEDDGVLLKSVPAEQFGQMLADAKAKLAKLALTVIDESIRALSQLVNALQIKE